MAVNKYDYLRNFRFTIEIDGVAVAGFTRASGLKRGTDVIEHRAGDDGDQTHRLGGIVRYDAVVLEKGVALDETFVKWCQDWYPNKKSEVECIKSVTINVKDKKGNVQRYYTLREAWPSDFDISDLDSRGTDVMVERLVLQHDGFSIGKGASEKAL